MSIKACHFEAVEIMMLVFVLVDLLEIVLGKGVICKNEIALVLRLFVFIRDISGP